MISVREAIREGYKNWIRKNQCEKCLYKQKLHHETDPTCNYALLAGRTKWLVAIQNGWSLYDQKTCRFFVPRRNAKPVHGEPEEIVPAVPSATAGSDRSFYTTDKPEQRGKCLSCDKEDCTNCFGPCGHRMLKRYGEIREKAVSMFASGASTDDVASALGIAKASAAGYLAHYHRRIKQASKGGKKHAEQNSL